MDVNINKNKVCRKIWGIRIEIWQENEKKLIE